MIEFKETISPFSYLDACGDFSLVEESEEYYLCAIGDIGGHGSSTIYNIANDIKKFISNNLELELDELVSQIHALKSLTATGMTLGLIKIFKNSSLISYVGVGNVKALLIRSNGKIVNLNFQDGIVGYTIPNTIVTNLLKINKLDVLILNTDGVSINQSNINLNLIKSDTSVISEELSKRHAKDDDDSLCLVVKYIGNSSSAVAKTINKDIKSKVIPKIIVAKTKERLANINNLNINTVTTPHQVNRFNKEHLLISILNNDKKIKDKLSKIFKFFNLTQKEIIKTTLFLLELQEKETHDIKIYFHNNLIQVIVEVSQDYSESLSCLFQSYIVNNTNIILDIPTNNFAYHNDEFNNFKELLKFGLDEETMIINQKLQKEVDKKLQELLEKEQLNVKLTNKAYIDNLTGSYNRYKFEEVFTYEFEQFKRYKHTFCIAMIDIDHFKNFNDTYGHLIGDEVLIMLADESKKTLRTTDTFARWGGEEFLILFKETSLNDAIIGSNKVRENISLLEHKVAGNITASFGVSEILENDTLEGILKRCDDALYSAKDNGRNRVEVQ